MTMTATIGPYLPYLRRYARSLTGSQASGDAYVRALLESMLEGNIALQDDLPPRIALYRLFHQFWIASSPTSIDGEAGNGLSAVEQRLQALQPAKREALLLTAVEGFFVHEAAIILDMPADEVEGAIATTLQAIDRDLSSRILIIEDEMIIALDLENLVTELGHTVVGIASTRDEAVRMATEQSPDLVLCDIQLADGSSGVDAASDILGTMNIPVIFITAFPECLLTGERLEPTYLIAKPFLRDTVKATIGQALFFHKPTGAVRAAA
ncbi:MAG TPA: response regulator [Rhizomicrobium sp.]|nr:response regulator [Rhizomicrobium sp.]